MEKLENYENEKETKKDYLSRIKEMIGNALFLGEKCPKCGNAMSQGRCTTCGFGC